MKRSRAWQWVSRSSMRLGVAASLLLHGLIVGWMVLHPLIAPPVEEPRPGEVWFDLSRPPPPPPEPKKEEAKKEPTKSLVKTPKSAVREPTQSAKKPDATDAPTDAPRASDSPRAADTPKLTVLVPSTVGGTFEVEPSRGETIHPDDPRFDPDVIAAKEKQRVTARVDGWAEDTLADARAQRGLPHPYFTALGAAGRAGLDKRAAEVGLHASPALAARVLSDRMQSATESYGKGGDPDLGPPGQAPRLSEKITQPDQQALKALAQATELFQDLTHNKPLLTLTLEFRQSKTTNQTKTTIIKASIDPAFDAFVLEAWPLSIAAAGPPPPEAFRKSELRSIWEIEGWPGKTAADKVMTYLPEGGVMGVPLTRLIPGAMNGFGYEFHAKLLRVY